MVVQTDVKTLLEPAVELTVSNLVESQFPDIFREIGPVFIEFVREYYLFLESYKQPLWYARRWPQLNDIDETIDDFLIYFKEKFLKNIQLETTSDVRTMIKHSLDIYRSKGSPQSIDLLFRLVFGVGAEIYFPRTDLLQPSSGTWYVPRYLEVSVRPNFDNAKFVGQQVVGIQSGSTAFVERMIRRNVKGSFDEILYISAINGEFLTGEKINFDTHPIDFQKCPTIIGSLTDINVTDGAANFAVGDRVQITGQKGVGAIGRVSALQTTLGVVEYTLIDGGWGYTDEHMAQYKSDFVLKLANVHVSNTLVSNYYFYWLDKVTQPWATINYLNANGTINAGDFIYNYTSGGAQAGKAQVMSITPSNSTAGNAAIAILTGTMTNLAFFTTSNAVGANLNVANSYNDLTAVGYVIGEWSNVTISVSNVNGSFTKGEILQNINTGGQAIIADLAIQGSMGTLVLQNCYNMFAYNQTVAGAVSGANAIVSNVTILAAVANTSNSFTTLPYNYIFSTISGANGTVNTVSTGAGSTVNVSTALTQIETCNVTAELISTAGNNLISAASWGFANGNSNASSNVDILVTSNNINVGSLSMLIGINPGTNYNYPPTFRVNDPVLTSYERRGWTLVVTGLTNYQVGEIVNQASTNATGQIISSNNGILQVKRFKLYADFANTTNTLSQLIGVDSGTTSNIIMTGQDFPVPEYDIGQVFCGLNARVQSNATASNGSVLSIQILDSGFVFQSNEIVSFTKDNINFGSGQAVLGKHGEGLGFYKDENGFLSANKKLFDGDYYQYFSYEIRSSLAIDKYETLLKEVLHDAGMKYFGALYYYNSTPLVLDGVNQGISIIPPDVNAWLDQEDSQWFFFWN